MISIEESKTRTKNLLGVSEEVLTYITDDYLKIPVQNFVEPNSADGERYGFNLAVVFSETFNDYVYQVESGVPFGALTPDEACGGGNVIHFLMKNWEHFSTSHYCRKPGQPNVHQIVIGFRQKK